MDSVLSIPKDPSRKRVVIVGGGFAGLKLAKKIDKERYQVVLIDKNNYYQFQPLLYQVASAGLEPSSVSYPHRKYFRDNPNFIFYMCIAQRVIPEERVLITDIGSLSYDYLVIATGCDTNFFGNEQIKANTFALKSISESILLRNRILLSFEQATQTNDPELLEEILTFVIVGGGATGVEVAGSLADMRKLILPKDYPHVDFSRMKIILVDGSPRILMSMSEESSAEAAKTLRKRGVQILGEKFVKNCDKRSLELNDGTLIRSRNVIWAAGVKPNNLSGLREEAFFKGRLLVDGTNKVNSYDTIFALGDTAIQCTEKYPNGHPQVVQVAIQMASNLADNLNRATDGKPFRNFEYKDKGSMATIGRNAAVAEIAGLKFKGILAWWIWLFIHILCIVGMRNKVAVFIDWVWSYFNYDVSLRLFIRPRFNDMYRKE